jgi:hypothetical protein
MVAQDTIYRADGSIHLANIISVTSSQIRYKPFDHPDGQTIVLSKDAVSKISYKDGKVDFYRKNWDNSYIPFKRINQEWVFKRNNLSLNVTDIWMTSLSLGYERLFESGNWGFKFPVSVGLRKLPDNEDYYSISYNNFYDGIKIISSGIALRFYPFGQEKLTYYAGVEYIVGLRRYYDNIDWNNYQSKKTTGTFSGFSVFNGANYNITKNFLLSAQFGIGFGKINNHNSLMLRLPFELNFIQKF